MNYTIFKFKVHTQNNDYDCSHITMTFSGLNCLLSLGDDLSRIDRKSIINSLKVLQLNDGRYFFPCLKLFISK